MLSEQVESGGRDAAAYWGKYSEAVTRGKVGVKFPPHVPSLPSN